MFEASLARAESSAVRKARKMEEIEARARGKFRKTAIDPERVRRQLELRKTQNQSKASLLRARANKKKALKTRLQTNLMADAGAVSALAQQQKKLRSKKILYGSTGEEVVFHPGDTVRLGDWAEFHTSCKYNGSVGVVEEMVSEGNTDDVSIANLGVKREFAKYAVRIPVVKSDSTFTSVIDSSLYQKVDKDIVVVVKKDKMTLVRSASEYGTSAAKSSWQDQTKGYFDEDDLVDPTAGINARLRVKQQIMAAKEARLGMGKRVDPSLALSREQKARLQLKKDLEEWREKDTQFHESNRTVSTALFMWNETTKPAPQKPTMPKFTSMTVKRGTALPDLNEGRAGGVGGGGGGGGVAGGGGRKVERREDPGTGGYYTRREFVDYYGDLTTWTRAKASARFDDS